MSEIAPKQSSLSLSQESSSKDTTDPPVSTPLANSSSQSQTDSSTAMASAGIEAKDEVDAPLEETPVPATEVKTSDKKAKKLLKVTKLVKAKGKGKQKEKLKKKKAK